MSVTATKEMLSAQTKPGARNAICDLTVVKAPWEEQPLDQTASPGDGFGNDSFVSHGNGFADLQADADRLCNLTIAPPSIASKGTSRIVTWMKAISLY